MATKKTNRLLLITLLVIVAGLVVVALIKSKQRPKGEEVEVEEVVLRTIKETVSASGKVFPEKEVSISSDVSGEIVELFVEEGDSVQTGQILAKIDPEVYISAVERGEATLNNMKSNLAMQESSIQSSMAQIEQIQAQLNNAERMHERNKKLLDDGVISAQDFESSESNLEQLRANLKSAQAQLESSKKAAEAARYSVKSSEASLKELKTNLNKTTIAAPTDGVVSMLPVEEGERVVGTIQMTGTEIMRIANFNSMEVQVEVSENDILRVSLGDTADIEVDAYLDETFQGIVTEIANSAANAGGINQPLTSDQVTNFIVKIRILPASYEHLLERTKGIPFRPGMSASVDIYTETLTDVVSVPIQSVTTRDKDEDEDKKSSKADEDPLEVVFLFEADTARMVEVVTGIQDNEYIEIKEGLEVGQQVVTGPYSAISRKLENGDDLHIKEEKDEDKKKSDDE
ncbi:MAG: efflux RND transporter periplasmic adaptor subunit [Saprospiraceae bacterium]|nr:efflux RND transporter periplasmic adaptor subunit [Saprospiraceae bacterium]